MNASRYVRRWLAVLCASLLAASVFAQAPRGLAARGATPAAFGRRCIPPGCVAPPSNIPDILSRRALPAGVPSAAAALGWPDGRIAALGATPELHHGLLEQSQPQVGQDGKDVVWIPTAESLVERILDMAKVTPQDYVIDLGSGDGRMVIAAARRGARALGIEYNPDMVRIAQDNAAHQGVSDKASFIKADLFESDFSQATVVTMFLLPDLNLKLRPRILGLKPGTRIVSNTFTMGEWLADETAAVSDGCTSWCTALMWVVPARVAGTWRLSRGELTLKQEFQLISGTLKSESGSSPIIGGVLRGDQIRFGVGTIQYAGRVMGNEIQGTVKSGGSEEAWTATRAGP